MTGRQAKEADSDPACAGTEAPQRPHGVEQLPAPLFGDIIRDELD